jgi:hypothetical protein
MDWISAGTTELRPCGIGGLSLSCAGTAYTFASYLFDFLRPLRLLFGLGLPGTLRGFELVGLRRFPQSQCCAICQTAFSVGLREIPAIRWHSCALARYLSGLLIGYPLVSKPARTGTRAAD